MAGQVFVGERRIAKPGDMLPADAAIALRGQDHPWVSRGGVKLAHALDHFAIDPAGLVCLALGASTGGFTEVDRKSVVSGKGVSVSVGARGIRILTTKTKQKIAKI